MDLRTVKLWLASGTFTLAVGAAHAQSRNGHGPIPHRRIERPSPLPTPVVTGPALDVVFAIDATGSMGDEIEDVKDHVWQIATGLAAGTPRPDVRFGLVIYRDRGDSEHTRSFPLTRDLDAVHRELRAIQATGGGDNPEDVDAGLELAVREMDWSRPAARMVFLIGDAPPQNYGVDRSALLAEAVRREIRITTLEASGMNAQGTAAWRAIADRTGGHYEALMYTQTMRLADGRERTVIRAGSRSYVAPRVLSAAERSEDLATLTARGLARPAAPADLAAFDGAGRASRGAPGGAPARAAAPVENNVGASILRHARARAAEAGVGY